MAERPRAPPALRVFVDELPAVADPAWTEGFVVKRTGVPGLVYTGHVAFLFVMEPPRIPRVAPGVYIGTSKSVITFGKAGNLLNVKNIRENPAGRLVQYDIFDHEGTPRNVALSPAEIRAYRALAGEQLLAAFSTAGPVYWPGGDGDFALGRRILGFLISRNTT